MSAMNRRRAISALVAWLAGVALLAGGVLTYSGVVLSDSDQFVARATGTLRDGDMRVVIARGLSSGLVSAEPDLVIVRPLVNRAAEAIVASAPFQAIVESALYDVHRTVFVQGADTVTIRLAGVGALADAVLRKFAPSVAVRLPASTPIVLAMISSGQFGRVSDVARALNGARGAGPWLLVAAVLGFTLSVALAVDHLAALRRCGLLVLCAGLLVVVLCTVARPLVLAQFAAGDARTAAGVVWGAFVSDLRDWAWVTAGAGALVAALAWVLGRRNRGPLPLRS